MNVSLERSLFEIAGQHFSKCVEEGSVRAAVTQKVLIQQTHRKYGSHEEGAEASNRRLTGLKSVQ